MRRGRDVFTLGYSTLRVEDLLSQVLQYGIEIVVDVRRWGRSTRFPQCSTENLSREFKRVGVEYLWMPELGGSEGSVPHLRT